MNCKAAINIKGEPFGCDWDAPHPGWAHGNRDAQAIWCSDEESPQWAFRQPDETMDRR